MFNKKIKQMKRFTSLATFKNYASENCINYFTCDIHDIVRAYNYYISDDGKKNDYSVNYCINISLEVKELIF